MRNLLKRLKNLRKAPKGHTQKEPSANSNGKAENWPDAAPYVNIHGNRTPIHFQSDSFKVFDEHRWSGSWKSPDYGTCPPGDLPHIYRNFRQWIKDCEARGNVFGKEEAEKLMQAVKQEIHRCTELSPDELSEEEYCNFSAWIASNSCHDHGLSGYCSGKSYIDINTLECVSCLLLAMFFADANTHDVLVIDPTLITEAILFRIRGLQTAFEKKVRIYVLLDKDILKLPCELRANESSDFSLWDIINDECFAVIREDVEYEEVEDGYPITVWGYAERLESVKMTPELFQTLKRCSSPSERTRISLLYSHTVM